MAFSAWEQVSQLVEKHENILIACSADYTVDSISSALAVSSYLQKLNKKHDIVCANFVQDERYGFLTGVKKIKRELNTSNKFVVKLNVENVKVKEFSYDIKDDFLNIYITPQEGAFKQDDISSQTAGHKYDLIITIDCRNLNSLGKLFTENSEFFYDIPLINIDHRTENEHFGQVNVVDIATSSVSEMLYDFLSKHHEAFLDSNMSTALLAGIITKTRSFKREVVTPKTLKIAGNLVSSGARKEEIIKNIYQRKSVELLQTWGKVLSRLQLEDDHKIVSSMLFKEDLENIRIKSSDIIDVIHELLVSIPEAEIIVLSYGMKDGAVRHAIWGNRHHDALEVTKALSSRGTADLAYIDLQDTSVEDSQKRVLDMIKEKLAK